MTDAIMPEGQSPLSTLFPGFDQLPHLLRAETGDLDDASLDWVSDEFGWAGWSIRQQTSHIASVVFRWLLVRWRDELFPGGIPMSEDELALVNSSKHDRRLNDDAFHSMSEILGAADRAFGIAQSVLDRVTVAEARQVTVYRGPSAHWPLMAQAHPRGVTVDLDGGGTMTLEATFRHMRYEHLTHMDNIQRIKGHLGLPLEIRLPDEGYHTVPGWGD